MLSKPAEGSSSMSSIPGPSGSGGGGEGGGGEDWKKPTIVMVSEKQQQPTVIITEVIKDRFYFATIRGGTLPVSTEIVEYFSIDEIMAYRSYNNDFGPPSLAVLYRFCVFLKDKLHVAALQGRILIQWTGINQQKRVNSAFLIGGFMVTCRGMSGRKAYDCLINKSTGPPHFIEYRDACAGPCFNLIGLSSVLDGLYWAQLCGFFDFSDFDVLEYEYYERPENGGLNWVVPEKLLGFRNVVGDSGQVEPPISTYFKYFHDNGVKAVVRLNDKCYDETEYIQDGFQHEDLYFPDGTLPPDPIVEKFMEVAEGTNGALAVHCMAGLGRTGTLIGYYLMSQFGFSAKEAVAWLRLCRPGSVLGTQQSWMERKQLTIRTDRPYNDDKNNNDDGFKYPIYSIKAKCVTLLDGLLDFVVMYTGQREVLVQNAEIINTGQMLGNEEHEGGDVEPEVNSQDDENPAANQSESNVEEGQLVIDEEPEGVILAEINSQQEVSEQLSELAVADQPRNEGKQEGGNMMPEINSQGNVSDEQPKVKVGEGEPLGNEVQQPGGSIMPETTPQGKGSDEQPKVTVGGEPLGIDQQQEGNSNMVEMNPQGSVSGEQSQLQVEVGAPFMMGEPRAVGGILTDPDSEEGEQSNVTEETPPIEGRLKDEDPQEEGLEDQSEIQALQAVHECTIS